MTRSEAVKSTAVQKRKRKKKEEESPTADRPGVAGESRLHSLPVFHTLRLSLYCFSQFLSLTRSTLPSGCHSLSLSPQVPSHSLSLPPSPSLSDITGQSLACGAFCGSLFLSRFSPLNAPTGGEAGGGQRASHCDHIWLNKHCAFMDCHRGARCYFSLAHIS